MDSTLKDGGLNRHLAVGAVLLAAGSASRMGHKPKCLLELRGVPLIRRQLIALFGAGIDEIVVVLGKHRERVEPIIQDFLVTVAINQHPQDGQNSSMRLGLSQLNGRVNAVMVALADQPLLNKQDYLKLIDAFKKRPTGARVVVPSVEGLPGNPVVFEYSLCSEILSRNAQFGCKQWQVQNPDRVYLWQTKNRRYRQDVDTPNDIEYLAKTTGKRLVWPSALSQPITDPPIRRRRGTKDD